MSAERKQSEAEAAAEDGDTQSPEAVADDSGDAALAEARAATMLLAQHSERSLALAVQVSRRNHSSGGRKVWCGKCVGVLIPSPRQLLSRPTAPVPSKSCARC